MKTRADQRLSDKLKKQWEAKFSCYPLLKGHIDGPLFTQPQTEIVNYARELRWRAQATELTTGQTEAGQESMDTQRVRATLKYPQSNEELKLEELPDLDCRVRVTTQDDGSLRLESFVYGAETEPVLSGTTRSGLNLKPCGGTITIRPADDEAIIFVNEVFSSTVDQREVDLSQVFRVPLKEAGTTDCLLGNNQEWELNQIVDYAESVWKGEMRGLVDGKLQQEVLKCATDNLQSSVRSLLLAMSHDAHDTQNTRDTKHTRHTQDTNREFTCHLHAGLGLMSGPTGQAYILPAWKVKIKQKREDEYGSQRCMSEHSAHLSQTLLPLRMTVCVSQKFRQEDNDPREAILVSKPKEQQANTDPKSSTAIKKTGHFPLMLQVLKSRGGAASQDPYDIARAYAEKTMTRAAFRSNNATLRYQRNMTPQHSDTTFAEMRQNILSTLEGVLDRMSEDELHDCTILMGSQILPKLSYNAPRMLFAGWQVITSGRVDSSLDYPEGQKVYFLSQSQRAMRQSQAPEL